MNKILILCSILFLCSCGSKVEVKGADKYIETITGLTCEKAAVTDNGYLVIAIDADSDSGYDALAAQFLSESEREGVTGLKGVLIVDIKGATFEPGAVIGKRIGKAYK